MTISKAIGKAVRQSILPGPTTTRKDCRFCKPKGYTFLPLRYAVVCDGSASQWPDLVSPLGANVTDKPLGQSRYVVRLLREGYLYVLVDRKNGSRWQSYAVTPGGLLLEFAIGVPPDGQVPFTCDLATDGVGASLVSVEKIEEVSAIHMLFSPDLVPVAMLEQREKDKLGMQTLNPKDWRGRAHTLQASELKKWVAEFKLNRDGAGEIDVNDSRLKGQVPIKRQLYPLMGGPGVMNTDFNAHGKRLTNLIKRLEDMKAPAVVLWDPIGITQELNRWMRAVEENIQALIQPHEWALQTSFQIEGLKRHVFARAAKPPENLASVAQFGVAIANPQYVEWKRDPDKWVKRQQAQAWSNYEPCYDESARVRLVEQVNDQLASTFAMAEKRFAELKPWLNSAALVDALEWYTPDDERCGVLFEYQVSLCTYGLGIAKGGQALLQEWATDVEIRRGNLVNRQFLFNQKAAIDEFRKVAASLKGQQDINTTTLQTMVATITGTFDKTSPIAATAEQGTAPVGMGGIAAKFVLGAQFYSTIGQSALRPASGAVTKLYGFLLYMRGGARDFFQGMSDMVIGVFDAAYASKAGTHKAEATRMFEKLKAAAKQNNSNFAALCLGTALGLVEAWNLTLKWNAADKKDPNSRETWELYAAIAATSGAAAISVGHLVKIVRNGSPWVSHLSLSSGMLGGFAAGVMAVRAFEDFDVALREYRVFAAGAFFVKGVLNGLAAAGSIFVGALYSGPLLERVGQIIGKNVLGNWVAGRGVLVSKFATRRLPAWMLGGIATRVAAEFATGVVGWTLILYQVGEMSLSIASERGRMNIWLMRCQFRRHSDAYRNLPGRSDYGGAIGRPYASQDEEQQEFQKALQALIDDFDIYAAEGTGEAGSPSQLVSQGAR